MTTQEKIAAKEKLIVKQARKIVLMRRKQSLWKELEPALNRLGQIVRATEKLEQEQQ